MKVAILGAGAAAFALAVLLRQRGHEPMLWSPSGAGTAGLVDGTPITATGVIDGDFAVEVAASCAEALSGAIAVVLALPAMGQRKVIEAAARHLTGDQAVIISAHISFAALHLDRLLAARGLSLPIIAWSTTLLRARKPDPTVSRIATLRKTVDIAVLPAAEAGKGLHICESLFGAHFNLRGDLLAVSLSNVNAQGHMALGLCNFTRMEKGEAWDQAECSTPSVEHLSAALDAERMRIAAGFGVDVRTAQEHSKGTHGAGGKAAAAVKTLGPATIQTRYILEDVPYGLVTLVRLAALVGADATLHAAGVQIFSALYGRDFSSENDLLEPWFPATAAELADLCREGFSRG